VITSFFFVHLVVTLVNLVLNFSLFKKTYKEKTYTFCQMYFYIFAAHSVAQITSDNM